MLGRLASSSWLAPGDDGALAAAPPPEPAPGLGRPSLPCLPSDALDEARDPIDEFELLLCCPTPTNAGRGGARIEPADDVDAPSSE